jgi:hypothetical protein
MTRIAEPLPITFARRDQRIASRRLTVATKDVERAERALADYDANVALGNCTEAARIVNDLTFYQRKGEHSWSGIEVAHSPAVIRTTLEFVLELAQKRWADCLVRRGRAAQHLATMKATFAKGA